MQDAAGAQDDADGVRALHTEELARTSYSVLRRTQIHFRRRDGSWQKLTRETYDHGNGAGILLYDPTRDCVLLVRQFRFPVYVNPSPLATEMRAAGWTIEVPAGMLDDHIAAGRSAAQAVAQEAEEEAGVRVRNPRLVTDTFMSPGSLTERVALFAATYTSADRTGPGGGLADEGEDMTIIEPSLDEAVAMVDRGEIVDAKTIILLYWAALNRISMQTDGSQD